MWPFKKDKEESKEAEKPKTAADKAVEALRQQIEEHEEQLEVSKQMLSELEKKRKTPFIETVPMRAYLRTMRFITTPFASLHDRADRAIEDPKTYRRDILLEDARELLDKCKKCVELENPRRKGLTVAAAKMRTALEDEEVVGGAWKKSHLSRGELKEEVARLRPPLTPEQKAKREEVEKQTRKAATEAAKLVAQAT
jgi:hypothetical protein